MDFFQQDPSFPPSYQSECFLSRLLKWKFSATTSQMSLALPCSEENIKGSRGLSLFLIKIYDTKGELNNIVVNRLKDKLDTKALPTAELSLKKTPALLIGERGKGIKTVASMPNITRFHNAICAMSSIQKILDLAVNFAAIRSSFGKILSSIHFIRVQSIPFHSNAKQDLFLRLKSLTYSEKTKPALQRATRLLF